MTATTTTIADALRAGIELLSSSREWFGDISSSREWFGDIDGSVCEELTAALRQYDDVLEKLRAALAEHTSMAEEIERLRAELAEANTPTIFWDDDWNAARGIGDTLYEVIESAFGDLAQSVAGPRYVRVGRARELPAITVRAWIDGEGALQWEKAHDA